MTLQLSSGASIPTLGFGTFGLQSYDTLKEAVLKHGYRHIDTASYYQNEEEVGKAIKEILDEGTISRKDLFVTTKIWPSDYANIEGALNTSLEKLGLEYVDLYLLHLPFNLADENGVRPRIPMHKIWAKMESLVEAGSVKNIGVSNFNVQLLLDMQTYWNIPAAVNQVEAHPYYQSRDLIKFCQDNGIVVTAYSPLGNPGRFDLGLQGGPKESVLEQPVIKDIAKSHGVTEGQVVIAWGLSRGYSIIPKTNSADRAKQNIDALKIKLTREEIDKINELESGAKVIDPDYFGPTWAPIYA